ncbi:sulfotransferase [Thalassotalea nanhaiensis]|uniref:Sulfotransferase n=1 Tax=Thalassotalea nanhaiensis TaxID=3065648 RepID=A0ABY9TLF9_9GAMM|nr:sulfotransferase [Colwelliaceae bacterium SQ345]
MILPQDYKQQLEQANNLHRQGQFNQAEALYLQLKDVNNSDSNVLSALSNLYLQQQKVDKALPLLIELQVLNPSNAKLLNTLIQILSSANNWNEVCKCYERFYQTMEQSSEQMLATHSFNYAYYLKLAQRYVDAIDYFNVALNHNIDRCEEVYLSVGVIYAEHLYNWQEAEQAFLNAIEHNARYAPAYYNLATLYEEKGSRERAIEYFQQTLKYDASHFNALSRLAELYTFNSVNDPLISQLKHALTVSRNDVEAGINLNYALGKAFDECKDYQQAFSYYQSANKLNQSIQNPYSKALAEEFHKDNIATFNKQWFEQLEPISTKEVIFICGMFRSGSTLTEQILASHPEVSAAGELDFIPNLVASNFTGYPQSISKVESKQLTEFAKQYCSALNEACPGSNFVTDKRPDNFLYIGLIKTLFPNAKIIHTTRNRLDNCLSIYFLRLGESLNYATSLEHTQHYFDQHSLMMDYWKEMFPNDIFASNYEELINSPKASITRLLSFLKLDWHEQCLQFPSLTNRVKTASVWKVRKPLFTKSIGRWKNYEAFID